MSSTAAAARFPIGEADLWLLAEGNHRRLWRLLGSHPCTLDGQAGTHFAVWAPNARRVSVVGDFCGWNGSEHQAARIGESGFWALFIPGLGDGTLYKYEIVGWDDSIQLKTDPLGVSTEQFPGHASIVVTDDTYTWGDEDWMAARPTRDWAREPMAIYELHLGSWVHAPEQHNEPLNYRELALQLVQHLQRFGFTHVQLMPVMEHPFGGSWGYQVTGYFAPTSRYGTPDDFRFMVDTLHQAGIGVLLDWVPAHFPRDAHGLASFDGTHLYEHADPRKGEHPDWQTLIFNYGRREVRNFLLANALYWLHEFHADGLRVDAVSSMLYLDYSRDEGQWEPNKYGGRENIEAIECLREVNAAVREECPGALMIAEESTAWPGVSKPPAEGGLGFHFKWNMGWMHDTLAYFALDPVHRKANHDRITFAMLYEYSERFIMPLSHDEFVHGKGSLLAKMPGDTWRRFANLRLLLAYQYTRPSKKLLFMGTELAPDREWDHDQSLDWHLGDDPQRASLQTFLSELGALYRANPCLWRSDSDPRGFQWIDCSDSNQSVLCFLRWDAGDDDAEEPAEDTGAHALGADTADAPASAATPNATPSATPSGDAPEAGGAAAAADADPYAAGPLAGHLAMVLNLTPVPRTQYRVGVPGHGAYELSLCSDAEHFGGSGFEVIQRPAVEHTPHHGFPRSIVVNLPPLSALVLSPSPEAGAPASDDAGTGRGADGSP